VVFIQERAYVGGLKVDRSEAKFVDYLFSAESSREAILIEIKTPASRLLGAEYRGGVYAPSAELSGSMVQTLAYRTELIHNLRAITEGSEVRLSAFSPKCVLLAGNAKMQLTDQAKRKSFELFRAGLRDVEVITYDELFRKVEILAELFSLKRSAPATPP
jgi:antiviral defense system Shedu protein SduA